MASTLYDDGRVACNDEALIIRRYYPWGSRRVPYASIKAVNQLPLTGTSRVRKWRIWGSGDFVHWWNLDPRRPRKGMALVIGDGHRIHPTITPDDPDRVARILTEHLTVLPNDAVTRSPGQH